MSDPTLKISDVKSLKELAGILTYPVIAIAYFIQSGPGIGWGDWHVGINESFPKPAQLSLFFLYFTLKTIWVCGIFGAADIVLRQTDWEHLELVLVVASVVFIGIGLMGFFARTAFPLLNSVNDFWFAACLVWGFSCSGRIERVTPP
jgi:hypothetical protein